MMKGYELQIVHAGLEKQRKKTMGGWASVRRILPSDAFRFNC